MQPRLVIVTYNSLSLSLSSCPTSAVWVRMLRPLTQSHVHACAARNASNILAADLLRRKKRPEAGRLTTPLAVEPVQTSNLAGARGHTENYAFIAGPEEVAAIV